MDIIGIGNNYKNAVYAAEAASDISERKFMDRVNKGEKVNLFHENSNGVSVELSEEGLKKLSEDALSVKQDGEVNLPGSYEERVKFLQESLKPAQKLHRIIPNIQTNDKLEKSLWGADENIVDAAYSIIRSDLIPHNVGNLTEDERTELISIGLEKAKYLADRLEDDKAGIFMEAMNTIAKYGINGKTDLQGNVTYDIRWGAMVGAPDDYISRGELMQRIVPEEYKVYSSMRDEAIEKNDDRLALKAAKFAIDWEINSYKTDPNPFEKLKTEQVNWKKSVDNTKINSSYNDTDRSNMGTFVNSILQQNKVLNAEYLADNLQKFAEFFDVSF